MANLDLLTTTEYIFSSSPYANEFPLQGVQQIALQEGLRQNAYQDSLGNWTIGIGHTPAYAGEHWSLDTCFSVFFNDIYKEGYLPVTQNLPWTKTLSKPRFWVNVNASFNMGFDNWSQFNETFTAMQSNNLEGVVQGMFSSAWYNQVPDRVLALAYQYYNDTWVLGYLTDQQKSQFSSQLPNLV